MAQLDTTVPDTAQRDTAVPDTAGEDAGEDAAVEDATPFDATLEDGCVPSCTGKCGGADNGCGGQCSAACPPGSWCSSQACVICDVPLHCGAPGINCISCESFTSNRDCINRSCGCDGPEDCDDGEYCPLDNSCAPCTVDTACGPAEGPCISCADQTTNQACINRSCGCAVDDDCALGQWCGGSGLCVDCTVDAHCGVDGVACVNCTGLSTNKICVNRACGCSSDAHCALGQWCNNGVCADCTVNAHCGAAGVACVNCAAQASNKVCVSRVCGCNAVGDCFSGQTCNETSHLCEGDINQCTTGLHDCDACTETCSNEDDDIHTPGWTCGCATGFAHDGTACAFDTSSPPAVTFTSTAAHSITTELNIPDRICADAPSYSVVGLTSTSATLSAAPAACCLNRGDEVLLINLQGIDGATDNVGHWELLDVSGVSGSTIHFQASKGNYYGSGASDDADIGTSAGQQRVMLLRVPYYGATTVEYRGLRVETVIAAPWNGLKGGVLAARFTSLTAAGAFFMTGKGYMGGAEACGGSPPSDRAQQGESIAGLGISGGGQSANWPLAAAANIGGGGGGCYYSSGERSGGGGGYGTVGAEGCTAPSNSCGSMTDACAWEAEGGQVYGTADLSSSSGALFLGSGGGGGAYNLFCTGNNGAAGGGIIILLVDGTLTLTVDHGTILVNSEYRMSGGEAGGDGSGGSIYLEANSMSLDVGQVEALGTGHDLASDGGKGRVMIIYSTGGTLSGTTDPPANIVQQ